MAIPSVAQFRERFPEFGTSSTNGASDALISAAITHASEMCDATIYGTRHTQAVLFAAADDLARSPFARSMKLVAKDDSTTYERRGDRLRRIAACGIRALALPLAGMLLSGYALFVA